MTREETLKKIKEYLKGKGINIQSIVNGRLIIETIEQSIPDNDNFEIIDIYGGLTIVYESQNWKKLQMNNTTMDLDLSKVHLTIKVAPDGKLVIKYGDLSYDPKLVEQNVFRYSNSKHEFIFNEDQSVNWKILRILNSVTVDKSNSKIAHSTLNGLVIERVFNEKGFELSLNTKNYEDECSGDLDIISLQSMLTECNTFESLTTLKSEYSISRSNYFWWEACEKLINYTIDGITEISDNIILDNSDGFRTLFSKGNFIGNLQNYVKVGITNLLLCNNALIKGMQADLAKKDILRDLLDSLSRIILIQLNQYQRIYPAQFSRSNVPAIEDRSDSKTKNLGVSTSSLRYSLMKNRK